MTHFRTAAAETAAPAAMVDAGPTLLIGSSVHMAWLRETVLHGAALDTPVIVTGEPGSGKSLVARALHSYGPRAAGPVVVIGCHAFPRPLLELELFGAADGGVTGMTSRPGILDVAGSGTVILERIDLMDVRTQGRLSRLLSAGIQTRVVGTTSSEEPFTSNVEWDPDLRRHLQRTSLRVPSLRERQADIPLLAEFFAAAANPFGQRVRFSAEAMQALSLYSWPGNVAQLRTVVARIASNAGQVELTATELPVGIRPRQRCSRIKGKRTTGEELFASVSASRESFWSSVYPLFMNREITRADLRDLIRRASETIGGDADDLIRVLNMPRSDRDKFARFLRKYGCELPT